MKLRTFMNPISIMGTISNTMDHPGAGHYRKVCRTFLFCLILLLPAQTLKSQDAVESRILGWPEFLELTLTRNFELLIEEFDVRAAEGALIAARVFEDPELEVILPNFDKDDFGTAPRNMAFELEIPLELGGKRRNRIRVARAELDAGRAGFEDFLRLLRAEAAELYTDLLAQQLVLDRLRETDEQLQELVNITVQLFEAGAVSEIEVLQTRIEAQSFRAELLAEQKEMNELMSEVRIFLAGFPLDGIRFGGELHALAVVDTDVGALVEYALSVRADVMQASQLLRVSEAELRLAQSERIPDVNLILGYHNEEGVRPAPGFRAAYAGFSVPLKFSGLNRGEVMERRALRDQARVGLDFTRTRVSAEVSAALAGYEITRAKRDLFTEGILRDAERVRDAVVYSYQRGEVSLLEVFEAQRTLNELYLSFYDAAADQVLAVIRLNSVTGRWSDALFE